ncbi:MAG: hypothetical protein MZW92_29105 [Comamonadaceae bacterium]|nr:hypothetical protein [Comamonadaceae bacterium]
MLDWLAEPRHFNRLMAITLRVRGGAGGAVQPGDLLQGRQGDLRTADERHPRRYPVPAVFHPGYLRRCPWACSSVPAASMSCRAATTTCSRWRHW